MKVISENKSAFFNYQILEKYRAGLVLQGQEVKAIKNQKISLKGAFVGLEGGEFFLKGATISPYQPKNLPLDYNPKRPRKLLLKKQEIRKLIGKAKQKGLTILPLKVYIDRGLIKLEIGVAKVKKKRDKREELKKKAIEKEIRAVLKKQLRG